MKYSNTIEYNINTKLDSSGLTKLQTQIKQLENSMQQMSNRELLSSEKVQAAKTQLQGLNKALTNSFDPSLGILDLSKFRAELDASKVSAAGLQSAFGMMGAEGQAALNGLTTQIANFNGGMERTSSAIDKVFTTFSNTFRWGLVSSFFSQFMNAIHSSIDYVKELDDSLTQIMLVTDYNRDSMNRFAKSANEAAKAVSMTTTGMTNASLIFAQQGYGLGQSQELATLSAKLANASQQDTATTSDQITAYMNAYGLQNSMEELTQQMDNWAKIANVSAADVSELAQASQRAASMANAVGVSGEALAAQIATIESVTREAPEQIGNGLKTLYARFSDIKAGKTDEDGVGLGKVTAELDRIGVKVLDEFGNIRQMDNILEDLMDVWSDLDDTAKMASAQALAGKYQINRFFALMDNRDMYEEYLGATGDSATGTLDQMNAKFANSIEGRAAKLQASLEGLFSTIFDTDDIYPWMDAAQGAVDLLQQFFDALGGGKTVLLGLSALLTQVFSQNIARSINGMVINAKLNKTRAENIENVDASLDAAGIDRTQGTGKYISQTAEYARMGALNDVQYNAYMQNVEQLTASGTALAQAEENTTDTMNTINMVFGKLGETNAAVLTENGMDTFSAESMRAGTSNQELNTLLQNVDFSDVSTAARNTAIALREIQQELNNTDTDSRKLGIAIDQVGFHLDDLTNNTRGYSSIAKNNMQAALEDLRVKLEDETLTLEEKNKVLTEGKQKIQEYITEMEHLSNNAANMTDASAKQVIADGGQSAQKAYTNEIFARTQKEQAQKNADKGTEELINQAEIKNVLDAVNAMQQLGFAIQAVHNLGSIWNNEDLSTTEKITQTLINLSMVLTNTYSGLEALQRGTKTLSNIFNNQKEKILEYIETLVQKKAIEEAGAQAEKNQYVQSLQAAQERIAAEVQEAESIKNTADMNVIKAETELQNARANLETAKSSLSKVEAQKAEIAGILAIAKARLSAAQAAIAEREALGQAVNPRAEADTLEALEMMAEADLRKIDLDKELVKANKKVAESEESVRIASDNLNIAREKAAVASQNLIDKQNALENVSSKLTSVLSVTTNALITAGTGLSGLEKGLLVIKDLASKLVNILPILLAGISEIAPVALPLLAFAAVAYGIFKDKEDQKAENSKNYEEAKSQLEQIKSLAEKVTDFQQQFESQKGTDQAFDGLAESAKEYSQSLRDLGEADKAEQIESATLRAELQNTEEAYQNLSDIMGETQEKLDTTSYVDMMNKAYAAISNTGESVQFLVKQEQELKDKRIELNNLPKDDPYRAQLEDEIKTLEEFIGKNQEAYEAKNQLMASALDYNLNQASKTNGWQFGILNAPGDRDLRTATLDWQSLNSILEQSVPGFAQITDENERLALALAHTTDEAQRAAIQIQQLLNSNENLSEGQKDGITQLLEEGGLSAETNLKLLASIDEDASSEEIKKQLQDMIQRINDGEKPEVVIQANMTDEEKKDYTRSQLNAWEPDGDLSKKEKAQAVEDFNSIADTFFENEDSLGKEGTPFEDYSEDLLKNADAMEEVVEGILRYNDAIDSISKNMSDWKDALDDGNELSKEHYQAVTDLQEVYSDFLGISTKLSKKFASNSDNLELLEEAANGTTSAYEDLQKAAAADIYMQISGTEDLDEAKAKVEALYAAFEKDNFDFEALDVGDVIDFSDLPNVRQAINDFLSNFVGTAEEAAALVKSAFGIDLTPEMFNVQQQTASAFDNIMANATQAAAFMQTEMDKGKSALEFHVNSKVTAKPDTQQDVITFTDLQPVETEGTDISGTMPTVTTAAGVMTMGTEEGPEWHAHIPGLGYKAIDKHAVQMKSFTGFGQEQTVEDGPGEGTVTLKNDASGTKSPTSIPKSPIASSPSPTGTRGSGNKGRTPKGTSKKNPSGGKKKEISTKDKRKHEKDYYEKVNSLLDKTDEVLKGIQDKQDKLIGDKARGNQNKQIRLLEKELRILKEKRDILKNQEKRDVRNQIKKDDKAAERVAKKAGVDMKIPDFKRNADGIITNYEEVSAAVDKTYNAMVDKQKAAAKAGKEELAKSIGEYIDKFDKLSKSLLEGGKRSDEIEAELQKINNDIQDAIFNIQDLRIEQFKLYTEARDGLKEALESGAELKKLFRDFDSDSFMNSFSIDDTPYGDLIESMSQLDDIYNITAEDASTFYDNLISQKQEALKTEKDPDTRNALEGAIKFFENRKANISEDGLQNGYLGILTQDLTELQGWMDNPKDAASIFGMDEASLFDFFKETYDLSLDEFKKYRQLVQETRDNILDIYNDAGEAIERQLDQFDRLSEKMERISDTYTLYYGEDSYDQLDQFYSRQGDIMQNQLNQMTAAYEYWQKAYEEALKVGDKKLIEEMQDRMDDAEDAMLDAAQELAELWVEKFENAVEASSQHIYKNLFGSNDIDELTDNWELQKDYMDRYKDDVEKAYEIDKLRSKYLDLLDDAQGSSAQTQNRIRQQMQEQLDLLQKQNTVTEYDVKLANAKLEILQKQMALEDAQRNKNKMQLRRDTQGNYRYVYTADQGDVKEAQQDLADSEYDAYEMTKEETVANNDRAISLLQNYVEKRAAIWNKYKDDATARGIALANLESEYDDIFKALAEDFADTSAGMYDVLNWLVKNGSEDTTTAALGMLDALYDKNGKVKDKTGQDWMDMANLIGDQILPNIVKAVTKADLEMEEQAEDLENKMVGPGGALTKIGSGADNITDSMGEAANATNDLAKATDKLFAALGADNSELQKALDKLKQYREQLEASQQTTSLLGEALNKANETIKDKNAKESYYQDSIDLMNGSKKFEVGQVVTLKKGTWVSYHRDGDQYDSNGDNGFRLSKDTQVKISHVNEHHTKGYGDTSKLAKYNIGFYEVGKEATKETGTGLANKSDTKKTERWHLNEDMLRQAITYDTGGYTGQWGGEATNLSKNGKLAVLHQKELVLNATDTENILAAITLMRDMTQNTISGLSTMNRMFKNNFNSSYNPVTEQRVEIQASFPNATDAEDIRAALLNLSDKAYQYANRTI